MTGNDGGASRAGDARKDWRVYVMISGRPQEFRVKALNRLSALFLAGFEARSLGLDLNSCRVLASQPQEQAGDDRDQA